MYTTVLYGRTNPTGLGSLNTGLTKQANHVVSSY